MTGRRWYVPWLFLAPALAVAITFFIVPFGNTAVLSLTDASTLGGGHFTGFANYQRLVHDGQFWLSVRNTALYLVVVVPLMVTLPLLVAMLVQRRVAGVGFFRAVYYSPVVASMVVAGLIWSWLLSSDGLVNSALRGLHLISSPLPFLTDAHWLLAGAMAMTVWKGLGYYMVVYLAALANVPKSLLEAAEVDGAGAVRRFWHVTVPTLRPTMILVATLAAIASAKVFAEVFTLSNGSAGPGGEARTLVYTIRETGLGLGGEAGYASAMSIALFVGTLGLSVLVTRLNSREEQA
ncbi:carbohydrate ABC transporter permease [Streptomyces sp. VRA16 Mangrove soil]|uniref:carbohydrate ABC transporter permease n=1 Tax=Streptomyces sp. VRA16 Mangrove soil TaxID=2817434 RepID=UPI001A9EACB4|nr:sugar ABC transporter permease [Streptomyces sp. VRA16 Mangrove soil]MBO1332309.1 sugar ABC transporter permease [Streptomyces sp. VRA16 Mangrove soil]